MVTQLSIFLQLARVKAANLSSTGSIFLILVTEKEKFFEFLVCTNSLGSEDRSLGTREDELARVICWLFKFYPASVFQIYRFYLNHSLHKNELDFAHGVKPDSV
ncbi:hypothetical protein K7X08_024238 [Anisodus acutangulus]|uniref:Uncharacterized protein n=1 Tax=Anisodus acutangulus TaxID=402998 RepID=A0A9Q1M7E9_9SOLA|nr:hypothetical protein K7X08_024238 [Anisodus acutangulus]